MSYPVLTAVFVNILEFSVTIVFLSGETRRLNQKQEYQLAFEWLRMIFKYIVDKETDYDNFSKQKIWNKYYGERNTRR